MEDMSRRSSRPQRPPVSASSCPCGLPAAYDDCCGRLHAGQAAAPSAELLMRSRFSAFVVQDEGYLLRTWHPGTRPRRVEFDTGLRWLGLDILDVTEGSAFHTTGTVTFRARYSHRQSAGELHEQSRFARHEGSWVYVEALPTPQ
jgi:SEC-C motif-containing protein